MIFVSIKVSMQITDQSQKLKPCFRYLQRLVSVADQSQLAKAIYKLIFDFLSDSFWFIYAVFMGGKGDWISSTDSIMLR
jgi:hypothetical protein